MVEVECEIEMYKKLQVTEVIREILGTEAQLVAVLLDAVLYACGLITRGGEKKTILYLLVEVECETGTCLRY